MKPNRKSNLEPTPPDPATLSWVQLPAPPDHPGVREHELRAAIGLHGVIFVSVALAGVHPLIIFSAEQAADTPVLIDQEFVYVSTEFLSEEYPRLADGLRVIEEEVCDLV